MKESTYTVEVIPLTQLPLTRNPHFTYRSTTLIPFGSHIKISFGKQLLEGITTTCTQRTSPLPSWIKTLDSVITPSLITKQQLELARTVSDLYFTPLGRTLRHCIPTLTKTRPKPLDSSETTPEKIESFTLNPSDKKKIKSILTSSLPLLSLNNSDENTFLFNLALRLKKEHKQILIIVPDILHLAFLGREAARFFKTTDIAILHSLLTKKEYSKHWQSIASGEASIVLATRHGLFAPFQNLGAVVLTEEQDQSYKQWDMSPRYHARVVAQELAKLTKAKLLFTTSAMSLECFLHLKNKDFALLSPQKKSLPLDRNLEIINLRLERYRKNYSPLSEELRLAVRDSLSSNKSVVLLVPQKGLSTYSVCAGCKKILRCPKSEHALQETREGRFRCPGCDYQTSLFPSCPGCGHLVFWSTGMGSERIERELIRLFPGKSILRLDGESIRKAKSLTTTLDTLEKKTAHIVVGTQMLTKKIPLPNLGLIAIIDADNSLGKTSFRGDERFIQAISLTEEWSLETNARVLVQTFEPEHKLFALIKKESYESLIEKLLTERDILHYPPSYLTLTLSEITTKKRDSKKYKALKECADHFKDTSVSEQAPQNERALNKKPSFYMKTPLPLNPHLNKFLIDMSTHYTIDRDPLNFS